jgi:RNA polymerase sigma factor (sigma-70 family)
VSLLTPAQNKLVEQHLPFVRRLASVLSRRLGVAEDELYAAGLEALSRLASRFDPARGVFVGYAYRRVRGAMFDAGKALSDRALARLRRLAALESREPLAAEVGETGPSLDELMDDAAEPPRTHAIDALRDRITAVTGHTLARVERDAETILIDRQDHTHSLATLRAVLQSLSPREQTVLHALYWEEKTLDEIAVELDIDRKTAWRTHVRTKNLIRAALLEAGVTRFAPAP